MPNYNISLHNMFIIAWFLTILKVTFFFQSIISSLLLRRDCCTFTNGEYVKAGLAELELWCCQAKEEVICYVDGIRVLDFQLVHLLLRL